jgi:hypothetical protein
MLTKENDVLAQPAFLQDMYFLEKSEKFHHFFWNKKENYQVLVEGYATPYEKILILKHQGRCLLANYYKEKYEIDIYVLSNPRESLPVFIAHLRKREHVKVGFVCDTSNGNDGHTFPLIYEKNGEDEHVIFLDSLGASGCNNFDIGTIKMLLNKPSVTINFYAETQARQVDKHSCANDAFIVLRDALREKDLMNLIKSNVKNNYEYHRPDYLAIDNELTIYCTFIAINLPSQLGKAVQSSKFLEKLSLDSPVTSRKVKTLGEFRNYYQQDVTITPIDEPDLEPIIKPMNIYLKCEGHKNVARVKKQFLAHQHELKKIYSMHEPTSCVSLDLSRSLISSDKDSYFSNTVNDHSHQVSAAPSNDSSSVNNETIMPFFR